MSNGSDVAARATLSAQTADGALPESPPRRSGQVRLGGVDFDNVTIAEAIARIDTLVQARRPAVVVTPNVDHLVRLQKDRGYANLVRRADLVLADGQPLVWASRLLSTPLKERVAGSDLFPRLCAHAARAGHRIYLFGGAPGSAPAARTVLQRKFPGLAVVGTCCPPLGFERDAEQRRQAVAALRATKADIIFVGLGSPKQERWIVQTMQQLPPAVHLGVGISFSFVAGHVKRAPRWMQRLGCEWLHRLCCEPRRLWKRYLVMGWLFLPLVLRDVYRTYLAGQRRR